ncbi:MAG: phage holin family protein [Pseudarcicella sp.]|nr:phage holin family protein [Pseudarcicella sp.]MBP6410749.1 phage holin family protein [Pseudarcicella sp.]
MINFVIKYLLIAAAILFGTKYLSGINVADFKTAIVVALAMGFLNTFIKPVLKLVSFPLTVLTLGLFTLVINVILVYTVAHFVPDFKISGFQDPLIFSLGISVVSCVLGWFL